MKIKWVLGLISTAFFLCLGSQMASADDAVPVEVDHGTGVVDPVVKTFQNYQWAEEYMYSSPEETFALYGPIADFELHERQFYATFGDQLLRYYGDHDRKNYLILSTPLTNSQRRFLESLALDFYVSIDPSILPEQVLADSMNDFARNLVEKMPGIGMELSPDPLGNGINIRVGDFDFILEAGDAPKVTVPKVALTVDEQANLQVDFEKAVKELLPAGVDAHIEYDLGILNGIPQTAVSYVNGGDTLGVTTCSAAFAVTGNNYTGVLTTAHCAGKATTYEGLPISNGVSTDLAHGDMLVLKLTGASKTPTYKDSNTTDVDITFARNPTNTSEIYCVHGAITNKSCGTPAVLNSTFANEQGIWGSEMTKMSSMLTQPGDSGAGWVSGSIARGVHWGLTDYGGVYQSVFARIGSAVLSGIHVVTTADTIGIA